MGPPELPTVPPPEHLTAQSVAGAAMLASVLDQPHKGPEKQRQYLAVGLDVANGTNQWQQ
jgi:hypothetical protein